MEKNFVAGVQVTQKDGTVTQFVAETKMEHTLVDSLAAALDEEAIAQGKIQAVLLALPRESGVSIGLGGSGEMLLRGFIYLQKAITEAMGPMAEILIEMVRSGMSKMQKEEVKNDGYCGRKNKTGTGCV